MKIVSDYPAEDNNSFYLWYIFEGRLQARCEVFRISICTSLFQVFILNLNFNKKNTTIITNYNNNIHSGMLSDINSLVNLILFINNI